jgi:hypothetical protein
MFHLHPKDGPLLLRSSFTDICNPLRTISLYSSSSSSTTYTFLFTALLFQVIVEYNWPTNLVSVDVHGGVDEHDALIPTVVRRIAGISGS